jgi:hypothetical protein
VHLGDLVGILDPVDEDAVFGEEEFVAVEGGVLAVVVAVDADVVRGGARPCVRSRMSML